MRNLSLRFARCRSGVSAVEFALTVPVMIAVFALAHVCGEALAIAQKVTATSRTLTDVVTRNQSLSDADLTAILNAASATMSPYSTGPLAMTVSEVAFDNSGVGKVVWSRAAYKGKRLEVGSTFQGGAGGYQPGGFYIVGAVSYDYSPSAFAPSWLGAIQLAEQTVWSPRVSAAVGLTN